MTARKQRTLKKGDCRHGTSTGYYYWKCRCDLCRTAASAAGARRTAVRKANLHLEKHGTASCYVNAGCRCEPCRKANRAADDARTAMRLAPKIDLGELA